MGLNRVFERLYVKVYVGIIVLKNKIDVIIMTCEGSECRSSRVEFESSQASSEMHEFINQVISETPFYYIAVLNSGINQGAIPVCDRKQAQEYADISLSKTVCVNDQYMLYSSKYELDNIQKMFKSFGIDFIFSPFTLLERLYKDKINSKAQLYVLIYEEYLTMAVYQNGALIFGSFELVDDGATSTEFDDKNDEEEISFDLDDDDDGISIDDLDALDDLSDLEDLDAIHELDDFADETLETSDAQSEAGESSEPVLEDFGVDYHRFILIQKRLEEYYKDSRYNNEFIETIYIADGNDSGDDLKRYLEEELFLTVIIRRVILPEELLALSKDEVLHVS